MQQETPRKNSKLRQVVKVLLWIIIVVILILGMAYWTAPSWVPNQLQKFLPTSIKLENLEFQRPGLTSTHIDKLRFHLGQENPYIITLNDVELGYSLWQKKLTSIKAKSGHLIWPESKTQPETPPFENIPLPRLPVKEVSLDELTIEGLFIQNIIASDIKFFEFETEAKFSSKIQFIDKDFDIKATAKRSNETLASVSADIAQAINKVHVNATPINSEHWSFDSHGKIDLASIYPLENPEHNAAIEAIELKLQGELDFQNQFSLILSSESVLYTQVNATQLGLTSKLDELLKRYAITSNIVSLSPQYKVALSPNPDTHINYNKDKQQLSMESGALLLSAANPSLNATLLLEHLSLNLRHSLTEQMQSLDAQFRTSAQDLSASYTSPQHKMATQNVAISLSSRVNLADASLYISDAKGKLSHNAVNYQGQNSVATISEANWIFQGQSSFNFTDQRANHQWILDSNSAVNGRLELDNEQLNANTVSSHFNFTQDAKNPKGLITGNYKIANLSLSQQPIELTGLTGSLQFVSDKAPTGKLTFSSAKYQSEQIGISSISGELDWRKQADNFIALGALNHQDSKIPFSYQFNLKNSGHNLKIKQSSLPISTITKWITILRDYPELSFSSGQLQVDSLDGDPVGLLFDGKLKLDRFNFNYDELYVRNWTIEDTLTTSSKLGGTFNSHIDEIELATDISITDISFLMPHTINSLAVTDFKGKLLKGSLEIPRLTVDDDGISPFTVLLKSIDIGALLSALNSEKLKLTGNFDFTLPLTIRENNQEIKNGSFKALSEGMILLKSEQGEQANIAFQALENFHYKELYGTLNYDAKGNYTIELNVLGSNPDLYNGFPIKLDLTLRGELPEMLYSMLISGDMTKPILDDLEQKQILNIQP